MQLHSNFATKLLVAATMLTAQPAFAIDSSGNNENVELRALADQTARHLAQNEPDAVYASMSPKLKLVYSRDELIKPASSMQRTFGNIESYDFEAINYGKRGVGNEWIRIITYWYHAKTNKYPNKTYLKVEVTQEQGKYYVAGYSIERVLLGGKLPFLKQ
jgi:hypothetical protein